MAMSGTPIGRPREYRGRYIVVTYYGPDLLAYVDGQQCGQFWLNVGAAQVAAEAHIDLLEKEKRK